MKNYRNIWFWLGIIGSLASIISVIIVFLQPKDYLQISINYNEVEYLSNNHLEKEPDLKIDYFYKEEKVKKLLKARIGLRNESRKTIIGKGDKKNIINDSLLLVVFD